MTDNQSQRAPYPGLRAFRREETDLFFGREDCINAMVDRLASTRFLAVLGSSGTGKSSLVRTGLLDALELGLMAKAGSRWKIVDFRPGGAPLKNLARRLLETEGDTEDANIASQDIDLLRAFLARGPRAVVEWCTGHLPKGANLLLLVDQFEELFRYQDYAGREEAEAFVAMLLESAHEAGVPIYVTITMRSEYLGACALIEGLSDAINAGMFLTPRMTRDHCRDAIVGPASVCEIDIEPALVNRLLNDLANFAPWEEGDSNDQLDRLMRRADQLPLLQYTLNRMWQRARERSGDARVMLTLDNYEAIGGLSGALNAHANQIFEQLGKQRAQVAEWIFRALTAGSTIADAVRRPTRLDDLMAACGGDEAGVRAVVDAFRAPGVNFLVPEYDPRHPALTPDTYIDISHESLIRQWKKLSAWLEAEGRAAQQWRRLVDRYGTGEMLRGRELANLIAWRGETSPNAAWARRYGGDYPAVIAYLDKSQRTQSLKRVAMIASIIGAFVLVAGFGIDANRQRRMVTQQSAELKQRLAETQAERARADFERDRATRLQASAEDTKSEFFDVLENLIFNLVPLTSSERGMPQTFAARRADGAQSDSGQDGDRTSSGDDAATPDSGDRITPESPETRNPALSAANQVVAETRRLLKMRPDDEESRRLFAVSLFILGEARLQADDIGGAEQAFSEGMKLFRGALALNPNRPSLKDDLALALGGMARVELRRKRDPEARKYLEEAIGYERELAKGRTQDRLLQNLQIHLGQLGDLYLRIGLRAEARNIFMERLQVRRRRLAAMPGDAQRLSDVSIALDRVGQLIRDAGDPNGSRTYFEEALRIDRVLHKRNPARRDWQENLVFSLTRIGDLDRQLNRQREALTPYEEALGLQRTLVSNSTAPAPQRTLASLLQKAGDIRRRLKDYPAAIKLHREELAVRRRLLALEPDNLTAQRNVSTALDYLGNAMREGEDLQGARTAFTEQLAIDRGIAKRFPDEVTSFTDLAWSLNRLGDLDRQVGRLVDASKYFEEATGIQRKLTERDPKNVVRIRALALAIGKLGQVRSLLKDHKTALQLHQEELELRRQLFERAGEDSDALRDLSLANDRVGNVLRDIGDLPGALKYYLDELALDRSLVERASGSIAALGDLQWTLQKVSDFMRSRLKDLRGARPYLEEMVGVDRRLVDAQPSSKDRHTRLKDDLNKLADLLLDLGDPAAARQAHGDAFVAIERWIVVARESDAKAATDATRNEVAHAHHEAGWHGLLAGRAAEALPHIEASLAIRTDAPWNTVNLGHAYLFTGHYDEALKLYRSVRNRNRTEDGKRTYADEIRDDFAKFRKLGLILPELARIEGELSL